MLLKDATVLIAEDEPILLQIMAEWFERTGCRVLLAENGADALRKIATEQIDAVVSDVVMPLMDGVSMLRHIKALGYYKPSVIFISGFHDISPREYFDLGVEAVLSKPFDREQLLTSVQRLLTDRAELWAVPAENERAPTLRVEFGSVPYAMYDGLISFGRGGFCIRSRFAQKGVDVRLDIDFASGSKTITGDGVVRWYEPRERLLGIEITYLNASCRDWVCQLSALNPTMSFIPANTHGLAKVRSASQLAS